MNVVTDEVRQLLPDGTALERLVGAAAPDVAGILERALAQRALEAVTPGPGAGTRSSRPGTGSDCTGSSFSGPARST